MIIFTYKGNEIKIHKTNFVILSDLTFSLIIFIWYILYKIGLFTFFSPLLGLIITFIQNMLLLAYFIYKKKINSSNAAKYLLIMFIFKLLPIISFYPDLFIIRLKDFFAILYLYAIYIIFIIILINFFNYNYKVDKVIYNDISGENIENSATYKLYNTAYEDFIKQII